MPGTASFFDEEKLRRALPFEIRPTANPGVFETPPPGPDFDPRNATAEELLRAGMPWRRSVIHRNPVLRALWDRLTARRYARVEGTGAPPRALAKPERRGRRLLPDEGGSYNTWAGPVDESHTYTGVVGTWVVPTVSVPRGLAAGTDGWRMSTWVGLDGVVLLGSNNVIQIGVAQQIDPDGTIKAPEAWYEWWLAPPVPSNAPSYVNITPISGLDVKPGDTVSAFVAYAGGATGLVALVNERNGKYFSKILAPPPGANMPGSSAEWIVEVPGGGLPYYQLPAFTPVTFTSALACNCNLAEPLYSDPTSGYVVEIPTSSMNNTNLTSTTTSAATTTISFIG